MAAVHAAKLDACENAVAEARLTEAPVMVALHRYAEGIITVSRRWPVDVQQVTDEVAAARLRRLIEQLDAFMDRAVREGVIRPGLPGRWARSLLIHLTNIAAHEMPELSTAQGADMVIRSLISGIGPA